MHSLTGKRPDRGSIATYYTAPLPTDTKLLLSGCPDSRGLRQDILAGKKHDPTFYPVIYGADLDNDWTDEAVWRKANPSLGGTVPVDKVRAACNSARQNPAEENSFRQLRLNQWLEQSVQWIPMHIWDARADPVNLDELEGRPCYGGRDLASTTDITAFVLIFPPYREDEKYRIVPWFWMPEGKPYASGGA